MSSRPTSTSSAAVRLPPPSLTRIASSVSADVSALSAMLAEDAVMVTDGGGKRKAALRILVGRDDIIRLLEGLRWRHGIPLYENFEAVRINGLPGLILRMFDGPETLAFEPGPDGRIAAIYAMRNPDKLAHI